MVGKVVAMAYIVTRIQVGDYDAWKPMFDQDGPGARREALGHRVLRNVDDPNEVYVFIEFATREHAEDARARLVESRVLDRFPEHHGPMVVETAEAVAGPG
jgi:hypothetical protein